MNSCGSEWTDSGKSALFVNPLEIDEIVTAIRSVLTDDSLVDSAAVTNRGIVEGRISNKSIEKHLSSYYVGTTRHD